MAKNEICSNCGYMGQAKKVTKGSILIEIVLWLFFLIPNLPYMILNLVREKSFVISVDSGEMVTTLQSSTDA